MVNKRWFLVFSIKVANSHIEKYGLPMQFFLQKSEYLTSRNACFFLYEQRHSNCFTDFMLRLWNFTYIDLVEFEMELHHLIQCSKNCESSINIHGLLYIVVHLGCMTGFWVLDLRLLVEWNLFLNLAFLINPCDLVALSSLWRNDVKCHELQILDIPTRWRRDTIIYYTLCEQKQTWVKPSIIWTILINNVSSYKRLCLEYILLTLTPI